MRRPPREGGFTLLEVLVALIILGTALVTMFRIGQGSLQAVVTRERGVELSLLAETVLNAARLGVANDLGTPALPMPPDVRWRIERGPLQAAAIEGIDSVLLDLAADLELVRVVVADGNGREVGLSDVVRRDRP